MEEQKKVSIKEEAGEELPLAVATVAHTLRTPRHELLLPVSILAAALIIAGTWVTLRFVPQTQKTSAANEEELAQEVIAERVVLPIKWGDMGKKMIASGVVDAEKFIANHPDMGEAEKSVFNGDVNEKLVITSENAKFYLNLLWAFGLANKNEILEAGPMSDPQYGGAGGFASTGGWTLARGNAMDHFSMHTFINLTPEQQELVARTAKNIYRPCCNNPTHFPDCNHGMAMLGLLELMAGNNVSEKEMYSIALKVNSYWFPSTYLTIAQYLDKQGKSFKWADPKELLGADFSSASGYRRVLSEVEPVQGQGGGGCGV